jgi:hypothetical protein
MRRQLCRQRAFAAVVAVAPLLVGCTERVALLTAEFPDADDSGPPVDAGTPRPDAMAVAMASADAGDGPRCSDFMQNVRLEFETPEVIIALDRSYSMFQRLPGGKSWWQASKEELATYIEANEGAIMFGYEEFPSRDSCDPGSACCGSPVIVAPSLNSHWDIEKQWHCDGPASFCYETSMDAPSGDALMQVRQFFDGEQDPVADRFVLLVTDGDPSCGSNPDECDDAQRQANRMFSMGGIKTMVLGMGADAKASTCLDAISSMGQTAGSGMPRFTLAGDPGQLQAQLRKAMAPAEDRACRYLIRADVKNRDKVSVTANFSTLPRDRTHKEGWDFDPPDAPEIQIYGSVCTKLKCNQIEHRAVRAQVTCTQCGSTVQCP